MKNFRYLDLITVCFVTVLLISNIASTKIIKLWSFAFDGGALLFPLVYIFGDLLVEVYGCASSRRVIWIGFGAAIMMSLVFGAVDALPGLKNTASFHAILGPTPRIVVASLLAYLIGEFFNAFILAKLKIITKGKFLMLRTIGSTIIGQGWDSVIFVLIAFYGLMPNALLLTIIISNYIFKILVEVLFTPVTYQLVNFLKKAENEDVYDQQTNFNPFRIN